MSIRKIRNSYGLLFFILLYITACEPLHENSAKAILIGTWKGSVKIVPNYWYTIPENPAPKPMYTKTSYVTFTMDSIFVKTHIDSMKVVNTSLDEYYYGIYDIVKPDTIAINWANIDSVRKVYFKHRNDSFYVEQEYDTNMYIITYYPLLWGKIVDEYYSSHGGVSGWFVRNR